MPEEDPVEPGRRERSRKVRVVGYALLALSFPPYFAMLWLATRPDAEELGIWLVSLLILSNALWYAAIFILGKEVVRNLRRRIRSRQMRLPFGSRRSGRTNEERDGQTDS